MRLQCTCHFCACIVRRKKHNVSRNQASTNVLLQAWKLQGYGSGTFGALWTRVARSIRALLPALALALSPSPIPDLSVQITCRDSTGLNDPTLRRLPQLFCPFRSRAQPYYYSNYHNFPNHPHYHGLGVTYFLGGTCRPALWSPQNNFMRGAL